MPSVYSLNDNISSLSFLKPRVKRGFEEKGINAVSDLLLLRPLRYDDKSTFQRASAIKDKGSLNTFIEVIDKSYFGPPTNRILKIVSKECGFLPFEKDLKPNTINLLCFNRNFMDRYIKISSKHYLTGQGIRKFTSVVDASSFELHPIMSAETYGFGKILPIYPQTALLTEKVIREAISNALDVYLPIIENDFDESIYKKYDLLDMKSAIKELHFPSSLENVEKSRRTLAFNELYFLLEKRGVFGGRVDNTNVASVKKSKAEQNFISSLPFTLTVSQNKAIDDILTDLDSSISMKRLLQGDVGSGKTIVAFISALHEIEKGNQVIMMVPTELLSLQHFKSAKEFFKNTNVRVALFKGGLTGKEREELLENIKNKNVDFIIGTHSLLGESVRFSSKFSYAIIDEEHRFGVEQREHFYKSDKNLNVLTMSATPIPRSLAEGIFGSLNVSTLTELPNGRLPIITYLASPSKRENMHAFLKKQMQNGKQVYFVTPRIDTDDFNLRDITALENELKNVYIGIPYGVVHGKVKDSEKERILNEFALGKLKYLIATSVVEVGLDNPNATCMVIERSDMFGLATLHQLRGRVGRGSEQSYCFLAYTSEMTAEAAERLKAMKESNDGFYLAEKDASIRGVGDILGIKQSGRSTMNFVELDKDASMLKSIRDDIINKGRRM